MCSARLQDWFGPGAGAVGDIDRDTTRYAGLGSRIEKFHPGQVVELIAFLATALEKLSADG